MAFLFFREHVPGARFFDMWQGIHSNIHIPRTLPDVKEFEAYCQSLGLNNDSHIVIYDQLQAYFAARLWFTFKVNRYMNMPIFASFPMSLITWHTLPGNQWFFFFFFF